ncbi:MAG: hypothetical protein AB7O91_01475 [Sphingomonas sp.]
MAIWLTAALIVASPAAAQQVINESGPIAHGGADTAFPVTVDGFRRSRVVAYGPGRANMSASYSTMLDGLRLLVTVYIYPSAAGGDRIANCGTEFAGVGQAIVQAYGGARPIENGRAPAIAGALPELSLRSVHQVRMPFDGQIRDVRTESRLYCYVGGRWQVKYRASATADYSPEILDRFIAQGPWPGRAAAQEPDTVAP